MVEEWIKTVIGPEFGPALFNYLGVFFGVSTFLLMLFTFMYQLTKMERR